MANQDAPNGFNCVGMLDGSDYHGKMQRVAFVTGDSTDTFIGDAVKVSGTGSADGTALSVAQAAAGDRVYGVLVSLEPNLTDEGTLSSANYRVGGTARFGKVIPMDGALFTIQEDSIGANLAVTDISNNIDIATVGTGSTVTGRSAMELDSGSPGTANTLVFRLMRIDESLGNEIGTNANWVVTSNLTDLNNTTGVAS